MCRVMDETLLLLQRSSSEFQRSLSYLLITDALGRRSVNPAVPANRKCLLKISEIYFHQKNYV